MLYVGHAGSELAGMLPSHVKSWWPLIEDVFNGTAVRDIDARLADDLVSHHEYQSISIDATLRVCLRLMGQASYRASAHDRSQAAFDDMQSRRRLLTVRGTHVVCSTHMSVHISDSIVNIDVSRTDTDNSGVITISNKVALVFQIIVLLLSMQ